MSEAKIKELEKRIAKLEKENKSLKETKSYFGDNVDIDKINDLTRALNEQYKESEKTLKEITKSGAFFVKGGPLQEGLNTSIRELDILLGRSDAGAAAFSALTKGIGNFQQLAKATQDSTVKLAGELSKQAAVLNELGLSYGDFSKNVDFAIYSMGASQDQVRGLNASLVELSQQVGMLPSQMSQNFQTVSKTLAYNFTEIKEKFVEIQRLSNETGVSIDNLMGKFGTPMDTIGGASQMAAKLNSLLGRNRFSATELLMMSEEDRMTSIRGALMESGVAGTALAGGVQGKFALQSINEVLGLGLDDTRRFLQTGGLKGEIAAETRKAFGGEGGENVAFTKEVDNSTKALEKFRMQLLDLLDPVQAQVILTRGNELRSPSTLGGIQMQIGALSRLGAVTMTQGMGPDVLRAADQSPEFRKLIETFSRAEIEASGLNVEELAQAVLSGDRTSVREKIGATETARANLPKLTDLDNAVLNLFNKAFPKNLGGIVTRAAQILREDSVFDSLGLSKEEIFEKVKSQIPIEQIKESIGQPSTQPGMEGTPVPETESAIKGGATGKRPAVKTERSGNVYKFYIGDQPLVTLIENEVGRLVPE
jgi:hypothetical protein